MAGPLKASFGHEKIVYCLDLVSAVHPIDRDEFTRVASDGFDDAELMARSQLISDALAHTLPTDRGDGLRVLIDALRHEGVEHVQQQRLSGVEPFRYLPIVQFVRDHGLDHFDLAMAAQHQVTQVFTAEFSIRPYLVEHTEATLARLQDWVSDPSEHVRRLVSEGTRTRLPWASRLPAFIADPSPVVALLDQLVDDPSEYVRRSVANNLNDIAKDRPDVTISVARRWWPADDHPMVVTRRRLIRHALRTLIKAGNADALAVLGYGVGAALTTSSAQVEPTSLRIGGRVELAITLTNESDVPDAALVDFRIWFVKANGSTNPKVFKGSEVTLGPAESAIVQAAVSVAQLSTRRHHPGRHEVDAMVNGVATSIGHFDLSE